MRRRRLGWIGIDIGARTIKLAQVERVGSRVRLHRGVVVPRAEVAPGEDASTGASHAVPSAEELRAALGMRLGFSGRTAACLLPMHKGDLRCMTIPDANPVERRAMVANELNAIFGSAADEWDFDYWETQLLGNADWQGTENVNVLAVPREWTGQLTDELNGAGLRCEVLDGLPLTLARAVAMVSEPEQVVGAVDWGHTSATFCIVSGGRPLFTRVLRDCGMAHLMEAVEHELVLMPHEARQLFSRYGFPDPNLDEKPLKEIQETIVAVGSAALVNFVEEMTKTLAYLHLHRPHLEPDRILLFGGGGAIRNVAAYLAAKIEMPVQPWHPADEHPDQVVDNSPPQMLASAMALSSLAFAT
jgi:Tfp pilus assembly PilM family ATPase